MNPSPTGHYQGNHNRARQNRHSLRYLNRLSQARFLIVLTSLEISLPPPGILANMPRAVSSSGTGKKRVGRRPAKRVKPHGSRLNARLEWVAKSKNIVFCITMTPAGLASAAQVIHSRPACLLKVARTIADIELHQISRQAFAGGKLSAIDRLLIHFAKSVMQKSALRP